MSFIQAQEVGVTLLTIFKSLMTDQDPKPKMVSQTEHIHRLIDIMAEVITGEPKVRLSLKDGQCVEGTIQRVDGQNNEGKNGVWSFGCIVTLLTDKGEILEVDASDVIGLVRLDVDS